MISALVSTCSMKYAFKVICTNKDVDFTIVFRCTEQVCVCVCRLQRELSCSLRDELSS